MAARYLVPALAVASRAAAQCSVSGTTTLQSQGDATALAACSTFSGSIALATGTVGQIALDGIEEITGGLIANNVSGLTSLSADSLTTIDDVFQLVDLSLTNLEFPMLTSVKSIVWTALTGLQQLNMAAQIQMAFSVDIEDTILTTLTGINLQTVDTLTLASNFNLNDISMQLANVTTLLSLNANGPTAAAKFPNLKSAKTLDLHNLTSLEMPALGAVGSVLNLQGNFFHNVSAPNLTMIGGDLSIIDNANLTNVSMPALTTIGQAFVVANNSELAVVNDFGSLETISGTLEFYGIFTEVTLPALKTVAGAFSVVSSDTTGAIDKSCAVFNSTEASAVMTKPMCKGGEQGALTEDGNGTTTSSSDPSQSSTGAANAVVITGVTGVLGVVAAIFGML